ncbi:MAG: TIGR02147 family protein [Bacteriovorax sp.]|nr:TIGR02147 family protein [Bacteriovorax sp.]
MDIFDVKGYKQFLLKQMPTSGKERGLRSKLAEFLGCQLSYVSLVLTTEKHQLSLEHGQKVCNFFNLNDSETDYFILLLSKARAGSKDLVLFYEKKIDSILKHRQDIKSRIKNHASLDKADQALYYSDWYYTAIHMILRCNHSINSKDLSNLLGLSIEKVHDCLAFLEKAGILSKEKGKYKIHDVRIHIGQNTPWLNAHHKNWRNRAILALDNKEEDDVHFSMITSISESAASAIRKKILLMIQENEPIIRDADDKVVYSLNLDFFKIY